MYDFLTMRFLFNFQTGVKYQHRLNGFHVSAKPLVNSGTTGGLLHAA